MTETVLRWSLCRKVLGLTAGDLARVLLPVPAAVLTGLCTELLRQGLMRWQVADRIGMAVCLVFGTLFYLLVLGIVGGAQEPFSATECRNDLTE
jgi:uncharacterized membrane protein